MNQKPATLLLQLMLVAHIFGCASHESSLITYDFPPFKVAVKKERADVAFEFYREEKTLLGKQRLPVNVFSLVIYYRGIGGDSQVWRIESPEGKGILSKITYGVVPEGFKQIIPEKGTAPPLDAGRKYFILARGEGGFGLNSFAG